MFPYNSLFFSLDLLGNSITEFPIGLPSSLKILWLDRNKIQTLSKDIQSTLDNLYNLEKLHLNDNQITVIYDYQLFPLTKLRWISLQDNPFVSIDSLSHLSRIFLFYSSVIRKH